MDIRNYITDIDHGQQGHHLKSCQIYKSKETLIVYQTSLGAGYAILMAQAHTEW